MRSLKRKESLVSLDSQTIFALVVGVLLIAVTAAFKATTALGVVCIVVAAIVPALALNGKAKQKYIFTLLGLSTLFVVVPVLAIVYLLATRGLPGISWKFLTTAPTYLAPSTTDLLMGTTPSAESAGGIMPAIVGTVYLILGTTIFALPLGVFSAIYLSEYAKPGHFTRIVRLAIVNLAGVPSVVYGLFGLGLFVYLLKFGVSLLSGSLTLAILTLPVVITASEEAMSSVPQSFRDASLALGATRWQTTVRAVLPNAVPGIITGLILGIGRAAGETAPILFTVAAAALPVLPHRIWDQCMALPYHLYYLATQATNAPEATQWGTALVLLALVLSMNFVAAVIRTRFRRAKKW